MVKRLVVGSGLRSSGYGGSDMDDFIESVGAFIGGCIIAIIALALAILLSPVFWLAVIAFLLISGS